MKPRPAHLLIRKVGVRGWEVRVVVADGGWTIATVGTASEAVAIAVERIQERQARMQEVTS